MKKSSHNSKTSDDIDMKQGAVTKIDKRNKMTSKKFGDDIMSENCDTNLWQIWNNPKAEIRRPSL